MPSAIRGSALLADSQQFLKGIHPQKLTWNLEMVVSNRNLLFQGSIFRFHVCFTFVLADVFLKSFDPKVPR